MTRWPISPRPAARFLRTFQSKAALRAFSTASAPPSMKNMWRSSGAGTVRARAVTNSAIWVV